MASADDVVASGNLLVIFSDGEDNSSGHHMMEAVEAAQSNDVLLFPIRYTETLKGGKVIGVSMVAISPLADFSFDYQDLHFALTAK